SQPQHGVSIDIPAEEDNVKKPSDVAISMIMHNTRFGGQWRPWDGWDGCCRLEVVLGLDGLVVMVNLKPYFDHGYGGDGLVCGKGSVFGEGCGCGRRWWRGVPGWLYNDGCGEERWECGIFGGASGGYDR
ncbi:hypothetical protein Tco_1071491, partial [Tanacetum coccineum]